MENGKGFPGPMKKKGMMPAMMPNTGPKSVRPPDEMAMKPMRSNAMNRMPDMMEKGAPMRPSDPTMASKPMMSGDGLGKMTMGMGGGRTMRLKSGMPEKHMPGSS